MGPMLTELLGNGEEVVRMRNCSGADREAGFRQGRGKKQKRILKAEGILEQKCRLCR